VRLEVRRAEGERLDLLCFGSAGRTAIEFKYFTARWDGEDPDTGEQFHLRAHAADDVARRDFVFDIARLERLCANDRTLTNGFAVMLTNHQALWKPATRSQATRDQEFRIHDGRVLAGTLRWGTEGSYFANNQRDLVGSYQLTWNDYTTPNGKNGEFRWLGVEICRQT
jgi:hypothetical protein